MHIDYQDRPENWAVHLDECSEEISEWSQEIKSAHVEIYRLRDAIETLRRRIEHAASAEWTQGEIARAIEICADVNHCTD